jgi:hypothetical protein
MSKTITIDDLPDDMMDIINKYSEDVQSEIEKELERSSDIILNNIQIKAPRSGRTNALADSFQKTVSGIGTNKTITIHSKEKGTLIHLVEFGFVHKSGKLIAPRPFMSPIADEQLPKTLENIKSIIKGEQ